MDREQEEAILRITAQYVAEVQAGDKPDIRDYTRRYPQYAAAILDVISYYHSIEAHVPDEVNLQPLSEISAFALEKAYERTLHTHSLVSKARRSLLQATERPMRAAELAVLLDISVDIVLLLEQRRLNPASVPSECYRRLAEILQLPIEEIRLYLATPRQAYPLRRKGKGQVKVADAKGQYSAQGSSVVPPQQSFRLAVEESKLLSEVQRKDWLAILEREAL